MFYTSVVFAITFTLLIPIVLAVVYCLQIKGGWRWAGLGAFCYFLFALVLRLPFLSLLSLTDWFSPFFTAHPYLYALFLGFTASLFEEGGRWIVIRFCMRKHDSAMDALGFGIGYGGIESALLVGMNVLVAVFTMPEMLTTADCFYGGIERFITMILHIGWSIMIAKSVRHHSWKWFAIPFIQHCLVDSMAMIANSIWNFPLWSVEAGLGLCALVMLWYINDSIIKHPDRQSV